MLKTWYLVTNFNIQNIDNVFLLLCNPQICLPKQPFSHCEDKINWALAIEKERNREEDDNNVMICEEKRKQSTLKNYKISEQFVFKIQCYMTQTLYRNDI